MTYILLKDCPVSKKTTTTKLQYSLSYVYLSNFNKVYSHDLVCHTHNCFKVKVEQNIVICQWQADQYCMLKPKAKANNWSARHWQLTTFCDCQVQYLFYHLIIQFVFRSKITLWQLREVICHFSPKSSLRTWFQLCMSRILLAAKDVKTVLHMSRPLFVLRQLFPGHMVGSRPMKGRKNASNDNVFCLIN